jgi:hypothetical protein
VRSKTVEPRWSSSLTIATIARATPSGSSGSGKRWRTPGDAGLGAVGRGRRLADHGADEELATLHFNGQSTIKLDGDRATGESYCIAHHLFTEDGERKLMVAWLRYRDTFAKVDGTWLFAERNPYVDWTETRPSHP